MLVSVLLVLLAVGLAIVAYAVFVERRWYRLSRYRLAILPGGRSLDVLHLSDLHITQGQEDKGRFLASLPAADITVVTGDMLGEPQAVDDAVRMLRPVRGRLASMFVLGSNDLYAPRPLNYIHYFVSPRNRKRRPATHGRGEDLVRALEKDGWIHLANRKLELDGLPMEIVGLDDPHVHRSDIRIAQREDPDAFGLAVVHSPDPAPELVALGYDLVVAGHTHGGQVRLPWLGALVTNCTIPTRLAKGLARFGPAYLHVSPGLGTSKYAPFRFLCRPEATLLQLAPRTT